MSHTARLLATSPNLAHLSLKLQSELEELARHIEATTVTAMVEIGERLSQARQCLAEHPEGGFAEFCETRLGITARRARDLICIYENLGHEGARALRGHSRRAVIDLSAPSMPADVREQVIRSAANGVIHTAAQIKALKERFERFEYQKACFERFRPLRHLPRPDEVMVLHNGGAHSSEPIDIDNRANVFIFESERESDCFELVCHDSRSKDLKTVAFEPYRREEIDSVFEMADICLSRLYEKTLFFYKPLSAELRDELRRICDRWNPPGSEMRRNCALLDDVLCGLELSKGA